jgi:YVTN family beta-propeller protein
MRTLLIVTLLAGATVCARVAAADDTLVAEAKISLGEIAGRIDHLAYDPARKRLYVAELGNDSVGIVDLGTRKLLRTVSGFKEPQGIAYEPSTDMVYVANGGDGSLRVFRGEDFGAAGLIQLGADADNVRIDRKAPRVYVGYGDGAIAIVDPVARKQVANIALNGHPESFQLDPGSPRLFVNVPGARVIAVASRDTNTLLASWKTEALHANFPLALDAPNNRVIAVFRSPARMEAFDMSTGRRLGGVDSCADADDVFVDGKRQRVYVICGQGVVDTYVAANAGFVRVGRIETASGARTGLMLAEMDLLAVAIRAAHGNSAEIWLLRPNDAH